MQTYRVSTVLHVCWLWTMPSIYQPVWVCFKCTKMRQRLWKVIRTRRMGNFLNLCGMWLQRSHSPFANSIRRILLSYFADPFWHPHTPNIYFGSSWARKKLRNCDGTSLFSRNCQTQFANWKIHQFNIFRRKRHISCSKRFARILNERNAPIVFQRKKNRFVCLRMKWHMHAL